MAVHDDDFSAICRPSTPEELAAAGRRSNNTAFVPVSGSLRSTREDDGTVSYSLMISGPYTTLCGLREYLGESGSLICGGSGGMVGGDEYDLFFDKRKD